MEQDMPIRTFHVALQCIAEQDMLIRKFRVALRRIA